MATDIATLGIQVTSDGVNTASDRLKNLESQAGSTEQSTGKLGQTFDRLGYSTQSLIKYIEAAAAALALMKMVELAKDCALLAARYETLGVVMSVVGKNAGYTSSQMAEFQASLQKTGISAVEARQGLALMGQAQIDFAYSAKLARIAQDAAVIGNINSSEAFNRMVTGLATGQSILLHHLGLMTNFESAYKKAADAAGKTTNQLTENEKVQIRVNEVIRAGVGIQGAYEAAMGTVGKQLTSLPRYFSDLMVKVGELGQGALFDAVSGLTDALKYLVKNFEMVKSVAETVIAIGLAAFFARIMSSLVPLIAAQIEYAAAQGAAALASQGLAAAQTGLQAALALVGGELGLIVIAVMAAYYAWDKYAHAQEDAQRKINQFDSSSVVGQLVQQNKELEKSVKLMTQTSAQKTAESESQFQVSINNLKKEEIDLTAKLATAKSNANVYGVQQNTTEIKTLESKLWLVKRDLEYAPKLYAENQKLLAQQEAARNAKKTSDTGASTSGDDGVGRYNRYAEAYNRMVDAIREGDPSLTAEEKAVQKLKDQYENLFIDFPEHRAELKALEQTHLQQVQALQAMKQAVHDTATEFQALFSEWENTPAEHSLSGEFSLVNEEILKLVDSLSGADKMNEFEDNLRKMEGALAEAATAAPDKVEAIRKAIELLKNSYADSSGLTKLQNDNATAQINLMENQFERQQAIIEREYQMKKAAYEKELALASNNAEKRKQLEEGLSVAKQQYDKDSAANTANSFKSQLSDWADYASTAANFLNTLADAQDKTSREGFEAAKKYSIAAAIMNTAAAIMNALATSKNIYVGIAMSALAAATGAIQIAKIQSTTYGGGDAGVAPVGSFNAGSSDSSLGSNSGIGSSIGTQYSSIYDQQSQESLQRLAKSADNASLAIGKVADGLTKIPDLFTTGSYLTLATKGLSSPEIVSKGSKGLMDFIMDTLAIELNPFKTLGALFSGKLDPSQFGKAMAIADPLGGWIVSGIMGGDWETKSKGLALEIKNGVALAYDYTKQTKDGGWFGNDKTRYKYKADAEWTSIIQATVDSISSTILHGAVAMGTTANLASAVVKRTNLQTTGKTDEEIATELQNWLSKASNELAKTVAGLEEYTFYNENAYDALVRLSTALQDTNEKFELIGATLINSTLAGANSAYKLQQLFGGSDAFDKAISTYFSAMFTDSEQYGLKAAQALRQVNTAFGEMDIAVPATREQFISLVNSLDTSTESGAALFAALMNISTAFGTVQDQVDAQTSQTQDLTTRLLTAMGYSDESDLYALKIKQQKELTEATQKGLDTTALAIVQQVEYVNALMKPIKTLSTSLHNMIDGAVTYTTTQAFALVNSALTSGDLSNSAELEAAAKVLNGLSSDNYSTALDYRRGQALANVMITNLAAMADTQISDAEKAYMVSVDQLNALTDITSEIQGLRNEVRAVATATGKALKIFDKWDGDGLPAVAA